jgi:hypothetical protein
VLNDDHVLIIENVLYGSRADWLWDDDLDMHIPCCSQWDGRRKCGNGPLTGDQILTGDCGKAHEPPPSAP